MLAVKLDHVERPDGGSGYLVGTERDAFRVGGSVRFLIEAIAALAPGPS